MLTLLGSACGGTAKGHDHWVRIGEERLRAYELAEAEEAFNRALQDRPGSPRAVFGRAYALLQFGLVDAASEQLEWCVRSVPDYAPCHRGLGLVQAQREELQLAEASLRRAAELAPQDARALASLGNFYLSGGSIEHASELLERAAALRPGDGTYQLPLAELALAEADWAEVGARLDAAESMGLPGAKERVRLSQLRASASLERARRLLGQLERRSLSVEEVARVRTFLDEAQRHYLLATEVGIPYSPLAPIGQQIEQLRGLVPAAAEPPAL